MRNVWSAFQRMHGRRPSQAEIEMLEDVGSALKLRDDDAVWSVFIVLSRYFELLVDLPSKMIAAADHSVKSAERAAIAQAQAAVTSAANGGASAMAAAVQKNMKDVTRASTLKWTAIAITAVIGSLAAGVFLTSRVAYQSGFNDASEVVEVGSQAAAWAYTAEGRQAYLYAKTGQLSLWMDCTLPGYKRVGDRCAIDVKSGVDIDDLSWPLEVAPPRRSAKSARSKAGR